MAEYRDPFIDMVIAAFEANGPRELKGKWKHGDVLIPPKHELPMGYVMKTSTRVFAASNMEDEHNMTFVAAVIYDYTGDLKESSTIVKGVNGLYRLIEPRNADGTLQDTSLLKIIRDQQQIADKVWLGLGEPVSLEYGLGFERRGAGIFSSEAQIRFNVRAHLARAGL